MKFIVGTKQGMTQVFREDGTAEPVTVLAIPNVAVTQVKTKATDGYTAVQVGYGTQLANRVNKAQVKKGNFKGYREFRLDDTAGIEVGAELALGSFEAGEKVEISAISKGKGFQGGVKRHGFKGGPRSHGQKHSEREPGSIGGGSREGGRVQKGMRMAGRMGSDRITQKSVVIVAVDPETKQILVRGAVPGRKGTVVEVRGA